ncbi:hypothetical protein AB3S75_018085 [Citrus x aurantiifolia]
MWILTVITWVAISAMAVAYLFGVVGITNSGNSVATQCGFLYVMGGWIGLIGILILAHIVRLTVKMIKFLLKLMKRSPRQPSSSDAHAAHPIHTV